MNISFLNISDKSYESVTFVTYPPIVFIHLLRQFLYICLTYTCWFLLQLYADIVAVCNQSSELEVDDVLRMQFLLATVCESARLLPAGPLLQRCSLQHGMRAFLGKREMKHSSSILQPLVLNIRRLIFRNGGSRIYIFSITKWCSLLLTLLRGFIINLLTHSLYYYENISEFHMIL
jgi:hypothetical protein